MSSDGLHLVDGEQVPADQAIRDRRSFRAYVVQHSGQEFFLCDDFLLLPCIIPACGQTERPMGHSF